MISSELRPLVDSGNLVIGIYSDAPFNSEQWWPANIARAFATTRRAFANAHFNVNTREGVFTTAASEAFVRLGIDFGMRAPVSICISSPHFRIILLTCVLVASRSCQYE